MHHRDPAAAFAGAIEDEKLSTDPMSPSFAGDYMYMTTEDRDPRTNDGFTHADHFKHIITRRYLVVLCTYYDHAAA